MRFRFIVVVLCLCLPCAAEDLDLSQFYADGPAASAAGAVTDLLPVGQIDLDAFGESLPLETELTEDQLDALAPSEPLAKRVLIVTGDEWCPPCIQIDPRLKATLKALEAKGWDVGETDQNYVQVVRVSKDFTLDDLPADLPEKEKETIKFPYFVKLENGNVVRRWRIRDGRLDAYTINWLATGKTSRSSGNTAPAPPSEETPKVDVAAVLEPTLDAFYPKRGRLWGINGSFNPSQETVIQHLSTAHGFDANWLQQLDYQELMSLHSDDHEGRVQRQYVNHYAEVTTTPVQVQQTFQVMPGTRYYMRGGGSYCPNCR